MTDQASSDRLQIPDDMIRDAVTAGIVAGPPPGAAAPGAAASESPAVRPAASSAREAEPRRRLAGIGGWAKTVPRRLGRVDVAAWRRPAAAALGLVLMAGLGFGTAQMTSSRDGADEQRWAEAASGLKQTHADVQRLGTEMKAMRVALDGLKGERGRGELTAKQAQLNEKLDRANAEGTAKIAKLADQLDRIEKAQRDPARLAALVERLDRIEKQTLTVAEKVTPTPPPKPVALAPVPDVTQTGSLADPKPAKPAGDKTPEFDPRKTQLDTHLLRDVEGGAALVEARNGRVFEVHPGQVVAGLGRIEAVERRGRGWIVVTAKGFIGERLP